MFELRRREVIDRDLPGASSGIPVAVFGTAWSEASTGEAPPATTANVNVIRIVARAACRI